MELFRCAHVRHHGLGPDVLFGDPGAPIGLSMALIRFPDEGPHSRHRGARRVSLRSPVKLLGRQTHVSGRFLNPPLGAPGIESRKLMIF